jgi:hypothetical protein
MSKRFLSVALVLTLLAAGGWALAQQDRPQAPGPIAPQDKPAPGRTIPVVPSIIPGQAGPAAAPAPQATPGRYTMVAAGAQAVLLDTATGKTWVLVRSGVSAVWVPARRLESDKDVQRWQEENQQRGSQREKARAEELQAREAELRAELQALRARAQAQEEQARRREEEARRAVEQVLRQLEKKLRQEKEPPPK